MATYLFDTGIIVGYLRGAPWAAYVNRTFAIDQLPTITLLSVVSVGELYSLTHKLGWGEAKQKDLAQRLQALPWIDINQQRILECYAEIDAYSQGKLRTRPLPKGVSSRNMGKNDLWIAATASTLKATLLTIDHDFDHLDNVFLDVVYIDQSRR